MSVLGEDQKDEIDIHIQKVRTRLRRRWKGILLLLLVACLATVVFVWVAGSPVSLPSAGILLVGLALAVVGRLLIAYAGTFILEFRLRLKGIQLGALTLDQPIAAAPQNAIEKSARDVEEQQNPSDEEVLVRAQRGELWAQHNLGIRYYNTKNNSESAFWFRKAAEQDDDEAKFMLADLLTRGEGVIQDCNEAVRLFQEVIDGNSVYCTSAEYRIGEIYASGKSVPKNYREAARYWKHSAEHGYELASMELGRLYRKGGDGFPNDFEESYFWFYVAVAAEDPKKVSQYRIDERDEMARRLEPESRRRVQERAHLWLEGKWEQAYQSAIGSEDQTLTRG